MTQSTIGKLRVVLGLDNSEFQRGVKGVGPHIATLRNQFLAVAGAAAALGAGLSTMALRGMRSIDDTAKAARRLDASIGGYRALEMAADDAGVSLSALANDVQTMNRELANIGTSGNAERALDKLGMTAEEISGLDVDEKIAVMADRVKALGLTSGETTAILRDLGVRNREMSLLMIQGGDAIRAARKDVDDYGLAISKVDASRIETAKDQIAGLADIGQYAAEQLALALVPAMGRLAEAMTDSLREGGALRIVIDGLVQNLERLGVYVSVAVSGFGIRYVRALVVARLATLSLSGALKFLTAAIIRTGIGALIIGAGELVYQFSRLVSGAGGFGTALSLLKDVAVEVWDHIKLGGEAMGAGLKSIANGVQGAFLDAFAWIAEKFRDLMSLVTGPANSLLEAIGSNSRIATPGADAAAGLRLAATEATRASELFAQAYGTFSKAANAPLKSIGALREAVAGSKDETDGAAEAADRLSGALEGLGDSKGGGSAGGAADGIKDVADAAGDAKNKMEEFKGTSRSAFQNFVTGAKSAREALADLLSGFANTLAGQAFDGIWGALFPASLSALPGNASGTSSWRGGLTRVNELGGEIMNLPRGTQIIPHDISRRMADQSGGANIRVFMDDDGRLNARIEEVAGNVSARVVRSGLQDYDRKVLPRSMKRVSGDPRSVG